jgi:hypothetical protein
MKSSKSFLILLVILVINWQCECRIEMLSGEELLENAEKNADKINMIELENEQNKGSLFKYLLQVYNKMAVENERLRSETNQLNTIVKLLVDNNENSNKSKESKRAMKNIALGFGK